MPLRCRSVTAPVCRNLARRFTIVFLLQLKARVTSIIVAYPLSIIIAPVRWHSESRGIMSFYLFNVFVCFSYSCVLKELNESLFVLFYIWCAQARGILRFTNFRALRNIFSDTDRICRILDKATPVLLVVKKLNTYV